MVATELQLTQACEREDELCHSKAQLEQRLRELETDNQSVSELRESSLDPGADLLKSWQQLTAADKAAVAKGSPPKREILLSNLGAAATEVLEQRVKELEASLLTSEQQAAARLLNPVRGFNCGTCVFSRLSLH